MGSGISKLSLYLFCLLQSKMGSSQRNNSTSPPSSGSLSPKE